MDYLETDHIIGYAFGTSECYLTCYRVFRAVGDPRANEVLERGYVEMHEQVAKLKDEELKKSFLKNVPWNRELVELWEEQEDKSKHPPT